MAAARPATGARYMAALVGAAFWELVAEAPLPLVPDEDLELELLLLVALLPLPPLVLLPLPPAPPVPPEAEDVIVGVVSDPPEEAVVVALLSDEAESVFELPPLLLLSPPPGSRLETEEMRPPAPLEAEGMRLLALEMRLESSWAEAAAAKPRTTVENFMMEREREVFVW